MSTDVGSAYDLVAAEYDRLTEQDRWMRAVLWRHYARLFRPGMSVLDVCCGTGQDALFLARSGMATTGIDASPGMVGQLRSKAKAMGIRLDSRVGMADDLRIFRTGSFDGIVSGFAGLNTVPDLLSFAAEARRVLRPSGRLIAHMLAPPGIWDWLPLALKGQWREARDLRRSREKIIAVCGNPIRHILLPGRETYARFFQSQFHLRRVYALGFIWNQHWDRRMPESFAYLGGRVEAVLGRYQPFVNWGRFFVLDLERR